MTRATKKNEGAELVEAFRRGKPVKVRLSPDPTSVLSIRVSNALLKELSRRAAAQNKPTSEYARDLIEHGLENEASETPAELGRLFARWLAEYQRKARSPKRSRRTA